MALMVSLVQVAFRGRYRSFASCRFGVPCVGRRRWLHRALRYAPAGCGLRLRPIPGGLSCANRQLRLGTRSDAGDV